MNRVQAELEENEKLMAEFSEQLTKLEDEAGEIMKACQEAEVCTFFYSTLYVFDTIYCIIYCTIVLYNKLYKTRSFLVHEYIS